MKLQSRINLLSLATLILLTGSLVLAGFLVISDIVRDMNHRLLSLELDNRMAEIEKGHGLLVRTGVAGIENYEDRMRTEVLDAFRAFRLGGTGKVSVYGP